MGKPRPPARIHGVVALDKPAGLTSRVALDRAARCLGEKRCGHAGTLDPMATGVLLLAFGEATKAVSAWMAAPKAYTAVVRFGAATATDDSEGAPIRRAPVPAAFTVAAVQAVLDGWIGWFDQLAPQVTALHQDGERDHVRVRRGEHVERPARRVRLDAAHVLALDGNDATLDILCGAGFYVRALARDLGEALGSAAHLAGLRRTQAGGFVAAETVTLAQLQADTPAAALERVVPMVEAMGRVLPIVSIDAATATALCDGKHPPIPTVQEGIHLIVSDGVPVCLAEPDPGRGLGCVAILRGFHFPVDAEHPRE
ncbi:MAG: tRNA pseudouridine(55) synthase TruB [Myxococcales bacterium]|nr:tRNA pseudouridine(55) synthase TruB [Myxococcales bacterium]